MPSKNSKRKSCKKRHLSLHINRRAILFPILDIVTLIFAQSLKSPVSFTTFVFALILPIFPTVWLIAAALAIRSSVRISASSVEKNTPVKVASLISNNSPIPFPFVEVELLLPDTFGAKCITHKLIVSLTPLDGCEIPKIVSFAFRGEYQVGLSKLIVSDPLGMASLSITCEHTASVLVLPRRLELKDENFNPESELSPQNPIRSRGADLTEATDVRVYLPGDRMRSIHWKLSSKSEELIVRDYSQNIGNTVCILCDLEAHLSNKSAAFEPLEEYAEVYDDLCTDIVIEYALAAALRELKKQNSVTILCLTQNDDRLIPCTFAISDIQSFEAAYHSLARAPKLSVDNQLTRLAALIPSADDSVIISTACLTPSIADECLKLAAGHTSNSSKAELIYSPPVKFHKQNSFTFAKEQKLISELSAHMIITQKPN